MVNLSMILCISQIGIKQNKIFNRAVSRKAAYRLYYMIAGLGGHVKGVRESGRLSRPLTRLVGAATEQPGHRNRPQAESG